MYHQYRYTTMDEEATERALELLGKAAEFRREGKPEQWAKDIERKALKAFERSYLYRNIISRGIKW